jgi:hypothetical protein
MARMDPVASEPKMDLAVRETGAHGAATVLFAQSASATSRG